MKNDIRSPKYENLNNQYKKLSVGDTVVDMDGVEFMITGMDSADYYLATKKGIVPHAVAKHLVEKYETIRRKQLQFKQEMEKIRNET